MAIERGARPPKQALRRLVGDSGSHGDRTHPAHRRPPATASLSPREHSGHREPQDGVVRKPAQRPERRPHERQLASRDEREEPLVGVPESITHPDVLPTAQPTATVRPGRRYEKTRSYIR
jgi:hypothetical protein